jgi:transposase
MEVIIARAAGLDVHKDTVTACVRTPEPGGGRRQRIREVRTFTHDLRRLRSSSPRSAST